MMDAIVGKLWAKFDAMQQKSATLIYGERRVTLKKWRVTLQE